MAGCMRTIGGGSFYGYILTLDSECYCRTNRNEQVITRALRSSHEFGTPLIKAISGTDIHEKMFIASTTFCISTTAADS
jgi:hypothetical protein